jgi:D-alanine-D-alanine ligase
LVVKPSRVGSTVGLTVVHNLEDLPAAVADALMYDDQVILERYIDGREYTVGVLNGKALAVGEIIPQHAVFDYECKYTPGMTQEIFPAEIPETLTRHLQHLAAAVHMALKLRDYSRVDFRVAADGTAYCLEVNTLPGLTSTSLFPQSAQAAGIDFGDMCDRICRAGLQRAAREQSRHAGE